MIIVTSPHASELNSSAQSNQSDQSSTLGVITNKLGHDLDEIRQRSLDHLDSKLDNGLITEDDLVLNRDLLVKLLDLISSSEMSKHHEKCVRVLSKLMRWPSTAKSLLLLNGLDILDKAKLEINEPPTLRNDLELIIDQLTDKLNEWNASGESSSSHSLDLFDRIARFQLQSRLARQTTLSNSSSHSHEHTILATSAEISKKDLTQTSNNSIHKSIGETNPNANRSMADSSTNQSQSLIASSIFQRSINLNNSATNNRNTSRLQSVNNTFIGKTNLTNMSTTSQRLEKRLQTIYYWLPLTSADKQFLEITENTLRSDDTEKIKSYCTFLQTNVFNDFPAEVFLQRSTILKILTDLTIKSYNTWQQNLANSSQFSQKSQNSSATNDFLDEEASLLKSLITCLHYYCSKLRKRIEYVKDPSTFCCKDFYSNGGFDFLSRSVQLNTSRHAGTTFSRRDPLINTSINSVDSNNSGGLLSTIKSTSTASTGTGRKQTVAVGKKPTKSTTGKKPLANSATAPNLQLMICNDKRRQESTSSEENESVSTTGDDLRVDESLVSDLQASIDSLLNVTNVENYETDLHDKALIQGSQDWPIHSFCFKLMETLIENLSLVLIKNNSFTPNLSSDGSSISTSLVPIICETINLLVEILSETKLEWSGLNLNEILMSLFQKFRRNLKFLNARSHDLGPNRNLNILNRIVYLYLVITFNKILSMMQSIVETSILMPSDLTEVVFLILNDVCLIESFKPIESTMSSILNSLDKSLYDIYVLSNEICESMRCACEFLMKFNPNNANLELLESAKKSLNYMDYHLCTELTAKLIDYCSKLCASMEKEVEKVKSDVEFLATSCMMSKNDEIRLASYSKIYEIVKESLNVQVATEVNSKRYKGINFLLLNKVFYQLITFGLFDKSNKVKQICESILQHLLLSELLIPESVRLRLTQLITIYMPFIQCYASLSERLGQCVLKMSDDLLTPMSTSLLSNRVIEDGSKLFLSSAIERLRCSLRYLFFKEKKLQRNNPQLSNQTHDESSSGLFDDDHDPASVNFSLNDFYMKFAVEKYCDIATKLKRSNRTFVQNNFSISDDGQQAVPLFQTENLLKIFNIFTSESMEADLKRHAGEQLAIMISTGDERLHRAFINLDGVNFCLRFLKYSVLKSSSQRARQHLFLFNVEEKFDRIQASCINCLCNIFYWNADIRQLYLFDVDVYRLILKCLFICYHQQLAYHADENNGQTSLTPVDAILYSNCQEDLACILFTLLFHQVSCLDYYHSEAGAHKSDKFDLSSNLKTFLSTPFNMVQLDAQEPYQQFEVKNLREQQLKAYELNYKLMLILRNKLETRKQDKGPGIGSEQTSQPIEARLKDVLEDKFRLYWNFKWHGGSMLKLCHDLLHNEALVVNEKNSAFDRKLCLTNTNKSMVKFTSPVFVLKQLLSELGACQTHRAALTIFDLVQTTVSILGDTGLELATASELTSKSLIDDDFDFEFYAKNSLAYYLSRQKCDWHLTFARFADTAPSARSHLDQILFSSAFRTLTRLLGLQGRLELASDACVSALSERHKSQNLALLHHLVDRSDQVVRDEPSPELSIDYWLFNLAYSAASPLLLMLRNLLSNYENNPTEISSHLLPLTEFVQVYFKRVSSGLATSPSTATRDSTVTSMTDQLNLPSAELLRLCIEQMNTCDVEKYRNLNKLSVLMTLIASLLRRIDPSVSLVSTESSIVTVATSAHSRLYQKLIKSLISIISILNDGRGGLSLSFMGNYATKSAHTSLLQLVKSVLGGGSSDSQQKIEVAKAMLCLRDQKNKLIGSSWLIPLMLHREPQIRSTSFAIIATLVQVPLARAKLMINQVGIWSIALNVLLNRYESSIVRTQACAFLVNMTQSIINAYDADNQDQDDTNISITCLHSILGEVNFYHQISLTLTMFYPFDTYSFGLNRDDFYEVIKSRENAFEEASICSPLLVSGICHLLYNLTVLSGKEAVSAANNGIIRLLVSYVKPADLLSLPTSTSINPDIVEMLKTICRYFNLCCQLDPNCASMFVEGGTGGRYESLPCNLVNDLVECLAVTSIRMPRKNAQLSGFYASIFELLTTFLVAQESASAADKCLFKITRFWTVLSDYLIDELLECDPNGDELVVVGLKFFAVYFSRFTQLVAGPSNSSDQKIVCENIGLLFDSSGDASSDPFGARLCRKLIKLFDRFFLVDTNAVMKAMVVNLMKPLFSLSHSAKQVAVDCGLIETLTQQLYQKHSLLNIKSLVNIKGPFKENALTNDMSQILLLLKYLMGNNTSVKEYLMRPCNERGDNLVSVVHSFWCWAVMDVNLLKATLSTLCTLTANNKLAINSISASNIGAQTINAQAENRFSMTSFSTGTTSSCGTSTASLPPTLLHSIIKHLQKSFVLNVRDKSSQSSALITQKYSFAILGNCARSSECKNIIWKSNLLLEFTAVDPQGGAAALRFGLRLERLWLTFLLSLSFTTDGQQFILKYDGLMITIIKLYEYYRQPLLVQTQYHIEVQYLCLLILRNLAFNPSNKSKLISNSDYLNVVLRSLRVRNEKFQLIALSALYSLLYDYQKVKVILKNSNALKYLAEIYDFYSKSRDNRHERILYITSNLIKILNES